jgi:hypothetical protein
MDEALKKEIGEMLATAIKTVVDPLVSQVGQVAEAAKKIGEIETNLKTVADTVAAQKPITAEDVKATAAALLEERAKADEAAAAEKAKADAAAAAEKAKADEASAALKAKRDEFVATQLKGVPARYHADLGDDEAKWADAAKAIRETFANDVKAAGLKVADVGGSAGGTAPIQTADPNAGGFLKMPG